MVKTARYHGGVAGSTPADGNYVYYIFHSLNTPSRIAQIQFRVIRLSRKTLSVGVTQFSRRQEPFRCSGDPPPVCLPVGNQDPPLFCPVAASILHSSPPSYPSIVGTILKHCIFAYHYHFILFKNSDTVLQNCTACTFIWYQRINIMRIL